MALLGTFTTAFKDERAITHRRTPRIPLLVRAGRLAGRLLPSLLALRTLLLSVCGFALITAAFWTLNLAAGLAAAGISLLVLEYLTASGSER